MDQEEKIKRAYRLCPCHSTDIEGIQTWLEDLAAQGLVLEKDSVFFGIWSFLKIAPRKVLYRLEAVKSTGWAGEETPDEEMLETAESMGWEYITKYRTFYIYCSRDPRARPLNSDPAVQAITVKKLRREMILHFLLNCIYLFILCFLRNISLGKLFLNGAMLGAVYTLAVISAFAYFALDALLSVLHIHRACKKLKEGIPLEARKPWAHRAFLGYGAKLLPAVLCTVIILGLLSSLHYATDLRPLEEYRGDAPFVSIQELYPEGTVSDRTDMGDYNTYLSWSNLISENTQWYESGHIQLGDENVHFILRLTCHETAAEWIAKGVLRDYYREDSMRYNKKRFEDLPAPDIDLDEIRVYSSYGIRYILLRQGSTVIHGTVTLGYGDTENRWMDWVEATADKLAYN